MNKVILYNPETKEELAFDSFAEASRTIGVHYQHLQTAYKRGNKCHGYVIEKVSSFRDSLLDYDMPRQELDVPRYATIEDKSFVAVKCKDKTNCSACDIFKLAPPKSWIQKPLCYDYNCGTHKIVDVCSRYRCIWKRKK